MDDASSENWKAQAATAFVARTLTIIPQIDPIIVELHIESDALYSYATRVESINTDAITLRQQIADAQDDYNRVAIARDGWAVGPILAPDASLLASPEYRMQTERMQSGTRTLTALNRQWDDLADQRRRADSDCVGAISRCIGSAPSPRAEASLDGASSAELFTLLSGMSPAGLAGLLGKDPALVQQFWNNPPPPEQVAKWWKGLSTEQQTAWINKCPELIGNLPGLDNQARLDANKIAFDRAWAIRATLPEAQRKALTDIRAALALAPVGSRYGLLDLNLDAIPPLAAVVLGDIVGASTNGKVTILAPGMNSTVGENGSMKNTTRAAQNLLAKENSVDRGSSHAVVAWIGYKTPLADGSMVNNLDPNSVLSNTLATAGAHRFAAELDGQYVQTKVFDANPHPYTAVVAHSYGTTMAADALTETRHDVAAVVFVASAGIDKNTVPDAGALHITGGATNLFKTHADDDQVAPSGILGSGRTDPNQRLAHDSPMDLAVWGQFGGNQFSSEGASGLLQTTGHDLLGQGGFAFPFMPAGVGQGYFDPDTESLQNVAAAATGNPSALVGPVLHGEPMPPWDQK